MSDRILFRVYCGLKRPGQPKVVEFIAPEPEASLYADEFQHANIEFTALNLDRPCDDYQRAAVHD